MEIEFKRDTAFRKQFFVPDSFAHPAKMDAQLLIWIVERYTKPGEVILDPMAGMGTTMLACGLGRDVVLVELEGKFCKMCRDNWEQVKMRPQLGYEMGNCQIIQGDARRLEGLLVDGIITSPPYAETGASGKSRSPFWERLADDPTSARYGREKHPSVGEGYSADPNNIGNLPYGEVDKIVTSPPFGEALSGGGIAKYGHFSDPELAKRAYSAENMNIQKQIKRVEEGKAKMKRPDVFTSEGNKAAKGFFEGNYSYNPQNIGNLPYGQLDKIVTSPPYTNRMDGGMKDAPGMLYTDESKDSWYTTRNQNNIGNLKYGEVDKIITSPPYEGSISGNESPQSEKLIERQSGDGKWGKHLRLGESTLHTYSDSQENIGNLKSTSYLEAMLQVYSQCHKVLKPDGLMILVLKNFIRNKQVIRLDSDTIKLCEQAGFKFFERHYRHLTSMSFWRIIYHNKYPEAPLLEKEDILVFTKT